eukprot:129093-Rhodomonas_salina.2
MRRIIAGMRRTIAGMRRTITGIRRTIAGMRRTIAGTRRTLAGMIPLACTRWTWPSICQDQTLFQDNWYLFSTTCTGSAGFAFDFGVRRGFVSFTSESAST